MNRPQVGPRDTKRADINWGHAAPGENKKPAPSGLPHRVETYSGVYEKGSRNV